MNDLYRDESIDRISQLGGTQVPEPGLFTGFTEWVPKLAARGGMATLRGMDLLGSIPAITKDYFKGGTEEQDKYFALHDFRYNQVIDQLTPGPKDVGIAGQVVGGLAGVMPQLLINWPTGLASMHLGAAEDLVREGVPAGRANTVGAIDALLMGLGMKLPMGNTLLQRIGTGAGTNVALGMAQRGASGMILQGTPAEGQYKAFDLAPTMIDLVMGMHFGAFAHLFNDPAAKSVSQEFKAMYDWAQSLKPSEVAALATIRQAQHSNVDSTPGKPIDPTDVEAHVNRLKAAVGMLAKDEPVNVENMPAGKFAPDPIKETENAQTTTQMVQSAEALRAEEGIREPTIPDYLRTTEAQRATYESLQQLPREEQAAGVGQIIEAQLRRANVPEHEAIANGAIWEAFAKTMGETHGISPADVLTKYRLSVSRGTDRMEGALEQAAPGDMPHPEIGPERTIEVDGKARPTTDSTGRAIASTPEGVRAFYKWFGDSKVVDAEGKPLVVYHGTGKDFDAFNNRSAGQVRRNNQQKSMWAEKEGFFFTEDPAQASKFAQTYRGQEGDNSNVVPVYLAMDNPVMIDFGETSGPYGMYGKLNVREFREEMAAAKKSGHDGAQITNLDDYGGRHTQYVAFKPTQIKSAIGNRGTFDANDPNILHQKVAEPFYSELARQVDKVDMKSAPVKGWKDWIKGQVAKGGVKAEEIKWSGLEEWLDLQQAEHDALVRRYGKDDPDVSGRAKVTKEQVQEFLRNNGVKVEEVMLGEQDRAAPSASALANMNREQLLHVYERDIGPIPESYANASEDTVRADMENYYDQPRGEAKFSSYQLPGGENYRELLLTLPGGESVADAITRRDAAWTRISERIDFPTNIHPLAQTRWAEENVPKLFAEWQDASRVANRKSAPSDAGNFRSSHFDQPNILAHVRFNERTDADGKKVLFIEEFQSDWAQQGRKKGFADQTDQSALIKAHDDAMERHQEAANYLDDLLGPYETETENTQSLRANLLNELAITGRAKTAVHDVLGESHSEIEQALADYEAAITVENAAEHALASKRTGVPSAPFVGKTDAWVALTLKRMIRYAAENGFDRIAWTRGEQQVERYSQALRKAVDVIEWKKTPEGVQIVGYKGGKQPQFVSPGMHDEVSGILRGHEMVGFDSVGEAKEAIMAHADWQNRWGHGMSEDEVRRINNWLRLATNSISTRNKVVDTTEKEDALSDAIGKSMADRIRNDPNQKGTIEGEAINVSDTGMAGFYDRIVPKVANEVLKKLGGGKVDTVTVPITGTKTEGRRVDESIKDFLAENESSAQPGFDITPQMRDKALAGQPLFQPSRGQIHFGDDQTIINLFENANASTFLHETGHFFLQVTRDLAMSPNAPIKAMEHWAAIAKELKIEGGEIPREAHETFARSFEAYLREGKAPTPELKSVFKQFRDWLVQIYQSIKDLNVELSDEMRAIMDRMLTSQSRETGETRSVPSETPGSGLPPPSIGGESPAAFESTPFVPLTIEAPEMKIMLAEMEASELGWETIGGRWQGNKPAGEPDFSPWIPKADWWPDRPRPLNEAQIKEALRKANAGEKLKKGEKLVVDYMIEIANKRLKQVAERTGIPPEDLPDMAQHLIDVGATADDMTLQEADLVAKAAEVDEAAVEAAAIQYENDKPGFLIEMRRITDEKEADQTQAPSETQGQKGGNETDRLLAQEADRYVMDNPDQLVPIGVNQDGSSIQMKASEYLAQARNEAALAREDIHLLEVAAGCLMGT